MSFGLAVNIYTDLRGYQDGLFRWGDLLFPLNLNTVDRSWSESSFVLYNLPDGLWLLSLFLLLAIIWHDRPKSSMITWFAGGLFLAFLVEVLQGYKILPGTYDIKDIFIYGSIFLIITLFLYTPKFKLWKTGKHI